MARNIGVAKHILQSLRDRGLHSGLLFQFLHAMLLIVEHGRREGERAAHAHVGKRDHDRALGVLGLDVADDSTHITEVRDFRDGLDGLDGYRVLLSREMLDQVGHQGDLERHRRIKDVHEFASLLWLIEHRRHPFDIERDDSIIADDREYGSIEPRLLEGVGLTDVMVQDHKTTYLIPDVDTLWRGGLGSFAVTASAIAHQDKATQAAIRGALERRATAYKTPAGLLPVAFKIGAGRKAT